MKKKELIPSHAAKESAENDQPEIHVTPMSQKPGHDQDGLAFEKRPREEHRIAISGQEVGNRGQCHAHSWGDRGLVLGRLRNSSMSSICRSWISSMRCHWRVSRWSIFSFRCLISSSALRLTW